MVNFRMPTGRTLDDLRRPDGTMLGDSNVESVGVPDGGSFSYISGDAPRVTQAILDAERRLLGGSLNNSVIRKMTNPVGEIATPWWQQGPHIEGWEEGNNGYSQQAVTDPTANPYREGLQSGGGAINPLQDSGDSSTGNMPSGTAAGSAVQGGTGQASQNGLVDIFQPDKYPTSYSGVDTKYINPVMEEVAPMLIDSLKNYEANIDKSTQAAQEGFQSQTRNTMRRELQGILNALAGRNMLNSTIASDAIGRGMGGIVEAGAGKGFEAAMMNAGLKARMPEMLGNLMSLGQKSESSDPLDPYKLLAQYDWNMS